jgi:hypothetical protein
MFTPLFTPSGEHSLLFRRMEGRTENFIPRGQNLLLGDNFGPGGQSLPLGAKLRMGLRIVSKAAVAVLHLVWFPSNETDCISKSISGFVVAAAPTYPKWKNSLHLQAAQVHMVHTKASVATELKRIRQNHFINAFVSNGPQLDEDTIWTNEYAEADLQRTWPRGISRILAGWTGWKRTKEKLHSKRLFDAKTKLIKLKWFLYKTCTRREIF